MTAPYDDGVSIAKVHRLIAEHRTRHPDPITELKLTRDEMDQLKRTVPVAQPVPGQVTGLFGIPVILVDKPEDSTLFAMTWDSLVRRLEEEQP